MEKEKIAEKYGFEAKELDKIIQWIDIIKCFDHTGVGTQYKISKKDAEALDVIANAKVKYILESEPEIEKISFKLKDGTTVVIKDNFIINCIQARIEKLANNNCLGVNPSHRPPKPGREPLRSILKDFIAFRNKPNPNQQYLDAGQFLADIGFLMNAEQWQEMNKAAGISHKDYIHQQVEDVLSERKRKRKKKKMGNPHKNNPLTP
jgi:hypothetical protein